MKIIKFGFFIIGGVIVYGTLYDASKAKSPVNSYFPFNPPGQDVSDLFPPLKLSLCSNFNTRAFASPISNCQRSGSCYNLNNLTKNFNFKPYYLNKNNASILGLTSPFPSFSWSDVEQRGFIVVKEQVLNLKR